MQNGEIEHIWKLLDSVPDPEIPVISVVELGVVREIKKIDNYINILITPTYSGCPAVKTFTDDIKECLKMNGFSNFTIKLIYDPPWTTDCMSSQTKQKLLDYGISPPSNQPVCPQCKSTNSILVSEFGATACKSLYKCKDCLEPFEHFKCI